MKDRGENTAVFSPFWPLCLMSVSVALFLGWQVTVAVRQYRDLVRLEDRQADLAVQAAQAEAKLQAMMMDLLTLSKTDADARAVVDKYGIRFNPTGLPSGVPDGVSRQAQKPGPKAGADSAPETIEED